MDLDGTKWKVSQIFTLIFLCQFKGSLTREDEKLYVNEFVVEFSTSNETFVREFAAQHGFSYDGKLFENKSYFKFSHPRIRKRSLSNADEFHDIFDGSSFVNWYEQQHARVRVKRDLEYPEVPEPILNDPKWDSMWYLKKSNAPNMRVVEAWSAGFTGKNVSVTILDDGIEYTHLDLKQNYDKLASGNINKKNGRDDDDPFPRPTSTNENRHGTRCAGEVAAVANNGQCGVGIAYDAKIGGVRMLDGDVTDRVEADSLSLRPQHVDIYSASWGPDDDGATVDGPAKLAAEAFRDGIEKGRGGKGSIFVWASGNGGRHEDNCNCDGYTDSIYTLSISAVTQRGEKPWYSESCSSTLASTYSSGSSMRGEKQIVSTDLSNKCTDTHTGTSAAAPLAAGICALALEANPELTWRDMQHIVVQTSKPQGLSIDDWVVNGAGYKVSHAFGFGMMDAYSMVMLAKEWDTVPEQHVCNVSVISSDNSPRSFSAVESLSVPVDFSLCGNGLVIDRLEHVEVQLSLSAQRRGDLIITLTSPMGTTSKLLEKRKLDTSVRGFNNWSFMTTHSWDEQPHGTWVLNIVDNPSNPNNRNAMHQGKLSMFNLILRGTSNADWTSHQLNLVTPTATTLAPMYSSSTESTSLCRIPSEEEDSCKLCYLNAALYSNSCVTLCPDGHFQEEEGTSEGYTGYVCRPCSLNCNTCVDRATCSQCVKGTQMFEGACVTITDYTAEDRIDVYDWMFSYRTLLNVLAVTIIFILVFSVYFLWSRQCSRCSTDSGYPDYKFIPNVGDEVTSIDVYDVPVYRDDVEPSATKS